MRATEIIGNIYERGMTKEKYEQMLRRSLVDVLLVSRREAQLARFRKETKAGQDIIVNLPRGASLRHGDVIWLDQDNMVVVQIEPEEVMVIRIRPEGPVEEQIETALKVGYAVGNQHLQVSIDHRIVKIPVEIEREVLTSSVANIGKIDIRFEEVRFERPEAHHEHG